MIVRIFLLFLLIFNTEIKQTEMGLMQFPCQNSDTIVVKVNGVSKNQTIADFLTANPTWGWQPETSTHWGTLYNNSGSSTDQVEMNLTGVIDAVPYVGGTPVIIVQLPK